MAGMSMKKKQKRHAIQRGFILNFLYKNRPNYQSIKDIELEIEISGYFKNLNNEKAIQSIDYLRGYELIKTENNLNNSKITSKGIDYIEGVEKNLKGVIKLT